MKNVKQEHKIVMEFIIIAGLLFVDTIIASIQNEVIIYKNKKLKQEIIKLKQQLNK